MDLPYESDLTDEQWELVSPSLAPSKRARPRLYGERDLLNAIFYVLRAGCQWRMVPHEYPQWQSVYHHFKRWQRLGAFDRMLEALLPLTRKKGGLDEHPSAVLIDSRSVKSAHGGERTGIDGNKKIRGRKHQIAADSQGILLAMEVHAANESDSKACLKLILSVKKQHPNLC